MKSSFSAKILLYRSLRIFSLEDKTAIITGAGSGLGRQVSIGYAESGARVVLVDNNYEKISEIEVKLTDMGYEALAIKADVTDADSIRELVSKVCSRFGGIDILVNAAGITRRMPSEDFDETDWDNVINVNLKGTFLCSKYVGQVMLDRKSGSIINFGSLGSLVAIPNSAAYCASKGAVIQLTKTMAVEWIKRGVRVNAIVPGTFKTPLLMQCINNDPDYEERMLKGFPIGRFGEPEEIVGACIFLGSQASSYVVGHSLCIDGGYLAI